MASQHIPSLTNMTSTPIGQEPMTLEVEKTEEGKYRVKRVAREGNLSGGKRRGKSHKRSSSSKRRGKSHKRSSSSKRRR